MKVTNKKHISNRKKRKGWERLRWKRFGKERRETELIIVRERSREMERVRQSPSSSVSSLIDRRHRMLLSSLRLGYVRGSNDQGAASLQLFSRPSFSVSHQRTSSLSPRPSPTTVDDGELVLPHPFSVMWCATLQPTIQREPCHEWLRWAGEI